MESFGGKKSPGFDIILITRDEKEKATSQMLDFLDHDIVCFSHLRWDFVYQRPQHLLSRFAVQSRVFFVEEPRFKAVSKPQYAVKRRKNQLWTVTPILPLHFVDDPSCVVVLRRLLDEFLEQMAIGRFVAWYYTPMALDYSEHLNPSLTVYDCMDELSMFDQAPKALKQREAALFQRSDLAFTGGQSLHEAKKQLHSSVHLFPSAVDAAHFRRARLPLPEPADQADIPRPRLGFYGVIDERMDRALVGALAKERPNWQIVLVGPVVKIDPSTLPTNKNIHYLGAKQYDELPTYLAGWDVAIMPFARNGSTRFISPTKTLEFFAARKPVISTGVPDVVEPYGRLGMVSIANGHSEFVSGVERILASPSLYSLSTDAIVDSLSWDRTFERMRGLIVERLQQTTEVAQAS